MTKIIGRKINTLRRRMSISGGYNPKTFWTIWGDYFYNDLYQRGIYPYHHWLLQQIKHLKPNIVSEIGCGFGRNISYLVNNGLSFQGLFGIDISMPMLKSAHRQLNLSSGTLIQADASKLPLKDRSCDLVFSMGLLMHVPPGKLNDVFLEFIRISKVHILIVELHCESIPDNCREYTFIHDYDHLFQEYGVKILNRQIISANERMLCMYGKRELVR